MNAYRQRLAVAAALFASLTLASAQGTAFTYQGRLSDAGQPANGTYDLRFALFDTGTNGVPVAGPLTNVATAVTDGLFTVTLDFGAGVFDGNARWLEVAVRTNGGGFTTLLPRQALNSTPYAIFAGGVKATGITGTIPPGNIASGTITSNMLAPGAAAANLAATGQGTVPSGAMLVSGDPNATNLTAAGYVKTGGYVYLANSWQERAFNSTLPFRGRGQTTIWTGDKMIVWGGFGQFAQQFFNDGGIFDPAANAWSPLVTNGMLAPRDGHTAVWTGTEMIIWGGYFYDTSLHFLNDGARYNPVSNSWSPLPTNGAPTPRRYHTAVWTGTEMIIWGGSYYDGSEHFLSEGRRYNPVADTWSDLPGGPAARDSHTAVWTGSEMIVWGGRVGGSFFNDGGRYNPTNNHWAPMTTAQAPDGRTGHSAVWAATEMIVWGGGRGSGLGNGGRYNPASDSWSTMDNSFPNPGRSDHTAVWTGREMVVWGGASSGGLNDGGSYNPVSNTWMPLTTVPRAPFPRSYHSAVWTGSEMIIWGGNAESNDTWSCMPPKMLYLYVRP